MVRPLYPYIVVRPDEPEQPQGIIVTDFDKKEPTTGIIEAVADGVSEVSPGDHIGWRELTGTYIDDVLLVDVGNVLYHLDHN